MTVPYYQDDSVTLYHGDALDVLAELPDRSVDAVVCDPPYELSFMGKKWDGSGIAFDVEMWEQCLRALKPGGHLLAFGGSRTWHRLAAAIEDAGFEIRDSIAWLYGQGMPKSLDVSKAIDKAAGAEREVTGTVVTRDLGRHGEIKGDMLVGVSRGSAEINRHDRPATDAAKQWQGWGTSLKPSFEPVVVARKPLVGTVAANVLEHGTGALNIDATRISPTSRDDAGSSPRDSRTCTCPSRADGRTNHSPSRSQGVSSGVGRGGHTDPHPSDRGHETSYPRSPDSRADCPSSPDFGGGHAPSATAVDQAFSQQPHDAHGSGPRCATRSRTPENQSNPCVECTAGNVEQLGRWPTNVVLDDTQAAELDAQSGILTSGKVKAGGFSGEYRAEVYGKYARNEIREETVYGDSGGASRFFPVFKYQAKAPTRERPSYVNEDGAKVAHNTVKPLDLMRWLVRLVTPPNGVVLDPFAGSGTTAEACIHEHKRCITIEREADYLPLIVARLSKPIEVGFVFGDAAS
ncbi:methyltransferase [Mycobacterium phage MKC-IRE-02]